MKIALSLIISALILSAGFYKGMEIGSLSQRVVTVKGLAEREVPADLVIWPIKFSVNGNDALGTYKTLDEAKASVLKYLKDSSIEESDIKLSAPDLEDRFAKDYVNSSQVKFRYVATNTITVSSENVDAVIAARKNVGDLIKKGVILTNDYNTTTRFIYTKLNEIKPSMIKDSTLAAREVAEQFARDSKSELGKIRSANQGLFSIQSTDQTTPQVKKVRVVTTVKYFLNR